MDEALLEYEEELEAFIVWMKDAGYTPYTRKSYLVDVRQFLISLNGKKLDNVKSCMSSPSLPRCAKAE